MLASSEKVIVIWSTPESLEDGIVSCITGHGGVRVYDRDQVDSRLVDPFRTSPGTATLPYFDSLIAARDYMAANPKKCIQLSFQTAARHGLT